MSDSPLPWGLAFDVDAGEGLAATVTHDPATNLLHVSLRNTTAQPVAVRGVRLRAPLDLAAAGGCAWLTGHAPGSPARVVSLGGLPGAPDGRLVETAGNGVLLRSAIVLGLDLPVRAESALVIGLAELRGADATVQLTLDATGAATRELAMTVELPAATVAPGDTFSLPALFVASGRDFLALYEDFADAAATATGARPTSPPPVCWLAPADPAALASGLAALAVAELGVDTVVVARGDVRAVAAVTATGLRAGVQVAAHDEAALQAAVAAGATWFSVSGLNDAPVGDARAALQRVRDAIGDGGYLHAADAPFAACLGIADACAVGGPDGAALGRWWMDGAWWTNDAGAVLPLDADPSTMDLAVTALGGGMVTLDGAPGPAAKCAAVLPPTGVAARPVEIAGEPIPFAWRAVLDGGRILHGLVNPSPRARWAVAVEQLQPGEVAFDQLNGRLPGMGDPLVGAGEALLWLVHEPAPGPRLIGDAASLGGRALAMRQVSGQLHLRNGLPVERTVAVESRGRAFELLLAPGQLERIQ